jgi:hypothetical protein
MPHTTQQWLAFFWVLSAVYGALLLPIIGILIGFLTQKRKVMNLHNGCRSP